ncbi:MAG: protoporphyrinogen oxidase [Actinomycetota bacterium]
MTIAVIGGGITGLIAARTLTREGKTVVLLEGSDRLGGKIRTHRLGGATVEGGADLFITRSPEAVDLCKELGLGGDLTPPSASGAAVWTRGALRRLPRGSVLGIPRSPLAALRSRFVGPVGAARTIADYLLPGPLEGPDVSIGDYLRPRLGRRVLERLVDPMLAASRSGTAGEMSLEVAAPEVDRIARSSRSVMKGVRSMPAPPTPRAQPFLGLAGGMERIVGALAAELSDVQVRLNTPVRSLTAESTGWQVMLDDGPLACDAVVLAVPPHVAAELLRDAAHRTAAELSEIRFAPAVVVGLVYEPDDVEPPADLSGVLVPSTEDRFVSAGAWFSSKWPHARSEDGAHVIRCFVGRTENDARAGLDENHLIAEVRADIAQIMGITAEPREARVLFRDDLALPVFRVGHLETMDRAEAALTGLPPIALAGAGYRGSGLPDCISSGREAAMKVAVT